MAQLARMSSTMASISRLILGVKWAMSLGIHLRSMSTGRGTVTRKSSVTP